MMVSKCSKNDTSSSGTRQHLAQNVIEKTNDDSPRDADGHKLFPYELYCLSKIDRNKSYLKKFGLCDNSILKIESVCKKRRNKLMSKR